MTTTGEKPGKRTRPRLTVEGFGTAESSGDLPPLERGLGASAQNVPATDAEPATATPEATVPAPAEPTGEAPAATEPQDPQGAPEATETPAQAPRTRKRPTAAQRGSQSPAEGAIAAAAAMDDEIPPIPAAASVASERIDPTLYVGARAAAGKFRADDEARNLSWAAWVRSVRLLRANGVSEGAIARLATEAGVVVPPA